MGAWTAPGRSKPAGRHPDRRLWRRPSAGHLRRRDADHPRLARRRRALHALVAARPRRLGSAAARSGASRSSHEPACSGSRAATMASRPPRSRPSRASGIPRAPDAGRGRRTLAADRRRRTSPSPCYEPEAGCSWPARRARRSPRVRRGGRAFELGGGSGRAARGRRLLGRRAPTGDAVGRGRSSSPAGPWLPRLFPELLGDLIRVTKQDVVFFGPPAGDGRFGPSGLPAWSTTTPRSTASRRSTAAG